MRLLLACALLLPFLACRLPTGRTDYRELPASASVVPDSLQTIKSPHEIVFNPANNHLYISGSGVDAGVLVLDATTLKKTGYIPARRVRRMWLNPLSNRLYISTGRSDGQSLVVVDCSNDTITRVLERNGLVPRCINLTNNKVYATFDRFWFTEVAIIDGNTSSLLRTIPLEPFGEMGIPELLWNPVQNVVYCNDRHHAAILVVDGVTDRVVARIRARHGLQTVAVNPSGNKLYATAWGNADSVIAVVDCRTNRIKTWLTLGRGIRSAAFSPTSDKLYVCVNFGLGAGRSGIVVVSGTADSILKHIVTPGEPDRLLVDSTGNRVFCVGDNPGWAGAIDGASDDWTAIINLGKLDRHMSRGIYCPSADRLYCPDAEHCCLYVVDCAQFRVTDTLDLTSAIR